MKKFYALTLILLISYGISAQVPQKMSYQAVIRNSNNDLVTNTAVGLRISILQGTPTGTVVYQEYYSPNPQTNVNGLVSVEIGGGTAIIGTFSSINWSAGPYYLKTETDPTGGTSYTIVGTSQLLSVPYALYSKAAENGFSGDYNDLINRPVLFNGTFSALTGKPTTLSGYGITDAMNTSHPANGINGTMISNWNTAYGWGNHATAGYAIFPTQTGNNGKYLKTNGSYPSWATINPTPTATQAYFQFVTYKPGSSSPVAFGFINSNGNIASSSGNFTCSWNSTNSRYEITISGESYFYSSYATIITVSDPTTDMIIPGTDSISGMLLIYLYKGTY